MVEDTVAPPDQRRLALDIQSAAFRLGEASGNWGLANGTHDDVFCQWPWMIFWLGAAKRPNAPDRFHLRLDCSGYPATSPTGAFWDHMNQCPLAVAQWPKGRGRFESVFRPSWKTTALYHPYDRHASNGHAQWPSQHPHLVWDQDHTIIDVLSEYGRMLRGEEYLGV